MIVGGLELFSSLEMILTEIGPISEPELRLMIEIGHAASISCYFANFLWIPSFVLSRVSS